MNQTPLRLIKSEETQEQERQGEHELIVAAQEGDRGAFRILYEKYRDRVFSIISYTLKDRLLSEDVLQTVFIKVFEALPYFRHESCFHTWIYRVTVNECRNRKRTRRLFVPLEDHESSLNEPDSAPAPDAAQAALQVNKKIQEAVLELRPKLREVVVLKYVEELSYEEMASVLGCSPGTVASRLHRALGLLETRLASLRGAL